MEFKFKFKMKLKWCKTCRPAWIVDKRDFKPQDLVPTLTSLIKKIAEKEEAFKVLKERLARIKYLVVVIKSLFLMRTRH